MEPRGSRELCSFSRRGWAFVTARAGTTLSRPVLRSRAPLRHRCDPASAAASAPLKPGGADKLLLSKRFYSAPAFDRGANNAETPQQPPRKVLCDAENGCRERRLFTPSAVNRLPARRGCAGGALVQGAAAVRLPRNQPTGGGAEGRGRLSGRPRSSRRSPTLDCRRERSDPCRGMRQRPAICCAARVLRCRGRGA